MTKQLLDEFFLGLNVSITLFPEQSTRSYKTIDKFQEFIIKEKEFWQSVNSEVGSRFQSIEDQINNAIRYAESNNMSQAQSCASQALSLAQQNSWPTVYSKTAAAQFIKKQIQTNSARGDAAIYYLLRGQMPSSNSIDYFKGYVDAYIFEESARSFKEAAATHETTLTELHTDYQNKLNALDGDYHIITTSWNTEFNNAVTAWEVGVENFKGTTTEWRDTIEKETRDKLDRTLRELEQIRKTYTEKLRLEGPATYWKELEKEYNESGNRWRWWAVGSTAIFVVILTVILLIHPDSQFITNGALDVNSLRNALAFTIITSICIYLTTLFVKLSVSSYHLARDAKERYQLTHVYLSLLNESAVNEVERITVLQSIFSRSDTGLLKGDSGPTIPDSLTQIIKLLRK
ncbi:DUF6161 domain-containing protein [Cohnella nanjingensis]|uniref:DUF6161 domain-containing protein n=1 Tax=Cohnella nanjingensis TaxID=1387779 RepID=A0A7X0VDR5_9BACL|nr:DUF6161 domain-containing protein [Cohnella nanjingensis]MBB6670237.1 hypothetical protein [Cohnella nanjingensis]